MGNQESKIQQACVKWFAMQYRDLWEGRHLFAIPNGGNRNVVTASIMKSEGVRAGIWDLFLTVPRKDKVGMWIEMKAGKNKLTPEQKAFRESHEKDYAFAVCYSLDEFIGAVTGYLMA